ncbi:ABC transporter ATP-binding protein (plasmid) [Azospirillum baldaniorum]|uniref:ABC transporter (ATP binding protein) n=2 Tax=Azospirillum TaxID=191 RepID=A0A9P1JZX6_9PROT|nr:MULTISPECIES: ABC transporter ATP-binding protein [Azospirillum]TWA77880.1 NitT/TauT family transport system ATP-binding protein [Azospirillum brasilense]AIB15947.1 ABC transporter ATP-binding protein [Azospirillum argentinense]AWJ93189.1 ABC transporter ATP-binding protein [Azospirillum baldaniorum]EZQ03423.1 ABC transporter ATP-binding protein [Azospirillum argentinense]CCD03025.1 putative ABC transporter (ATP binding protein) [Azospirillum baldaniorum]
MAANTALKTPAPPSGTPQAQPADIQIDIRNLGKVYGGTSSDNMVVALDGVDLRIRRGEFISLLGPSGCGKSTLLGIVAGFQSASSGTLLQNGRPIVKPDPSRTVVFQDYALFGWMTVQQNVEFGLKAKGMAKKQRAEIARSLIDMVRLTGFEEKYPHQISGGMKQRAAIARALAPDPDILLMDEPFGALDAQTRVLLQEEIARISSEAGKTVIFVTHGIDEAVFLADRVVVMSPRPGRVREEVTVPLPRPRTAEMRSDPWFVSTVNDLWETLKPEWQKGE